MKTFRQPLSAAEEAHYIQVLKMGNGDEAAAAREILAGKGVSYINISPSPENSFYKDFVADNFSFPTTYIVDSEGNMIGAPLAGNVKGQLDAVESRLELILNEK